jgi:hypothetical protein
MSEEFKSSEEFITKIHLGELKEYFENKPIERGVGFTTKRNYPYDFRYKPPIGENNQPDVVAIIGIKYEPKRKNPESPNLVPITVKISPHSRYISEHGDYDFDDKNCPSEKSIIASNKTAKPDDLISLNDYFFDHSIDSFVDLKRKPMQIKDLLDAEYRKHLETVHPFKGFSYRFKLKSRNKSIMLCEFIIIILKYFLKLTCGREFIITSENVLRTIWGYQPKDMQLLKTERIEVFGYKASANIIITFSFIVLFIFFIFQVFGIAAPHWGKILITNNFLALTAGILTIHILENYLPSVFFTLINLIIKIRLRIEKI